MEDKKCANKNRTKDYFDIDNLVKLKEQIINLKKQLEKLNKNIKNERLNDSDREKLEIKIGELYSELSLIKQTLYTRASKSFNDCVIKGDFCLTGTCIANILDTTTDYVLRKLKSEVDYVHLPIKIVSISTLLDKMDEVGEIAEIDVFRSFIYRDKEIFFSKSSFIEFLKNNLYEVGKKSLFSVNITDFINKIDEDINYNELEQLVGKFINKYSKNYEYEDSIDEYTAKDIVNFKVDLVRSSTLKKYLEDRKKDFLISGFNRSLEKKYGLSDISDIEKNEYCIEELSNFNKYYHTNSFIFSRYKSVIPIQDIQVNRLVSKTSHVKYHLKTKDNSKPIALFYIEPNTLFSKSNYDGCRGFKIDKDIVFLNLDASTNEDSLNLALNNYLIKNYTGIVEEV